MHECAVNAKNHITADDFKIKCWCGNLKPLLDYLIDDSAPGYYICPQCHAVFDAFTKPKEEWEIALDRLKGIKPTNYPVYNFRYGYKIQVQLMSQQKWFKSRTGSGLPAECVFIGEQRAKVWITCNGRLVVLQKIQSNGFNGGFNMNLNFKERFRLGELFFQGYSKIPAEDEHWIHGYEEWQSYCYECASKKVQELLKEEPDAEYFVDGGWDTEGDSTPHCETCHQLLSNSLTDYGCEAELDHFISYGFNPLSHDDCRSMHEVIQSRGWEPWQDRPSDNDKAYFEVLHKLCRSILDKHFWILPDNDFRHMWE